MRDYSENQIKQAKVNNSSLRGKEDKPEIFSQFRPYDEDLLKQRTIVELFEAQVNRTPENMAVVFNEKGLTYTELNKKANQVAFTLRAKGVKPNEIVGIMVEPSLDMMVGILGILKAGGAYMPIGSDYPEARIMYMLENSKANLLLAQHKFSKSIEFGGEIIDLENEDLYKESCSNLNNVNGPGDLAYVIYTSGTTGKPKGVMIEHRNVINLVNGLYEEIYNYYDYYLKIALVAPYTFDASIKQIFPSVLLGHTLHIVPSDVRLDGKELINFFNSNLIDITDGTPSHISMILNFIVAMNESPKVKEYVIGGEALPLNVVRDFMGAFGENAPRITNVYGPTECCDVTTTYKITSENLMGLKAIPIGTPITNVTTYILTKERNIAELGCEGEIYISGNGVGRGYINLAKETEENFLPDPFVVGNIMYKTGDLARYLSDGKIEYIGRKDHQVKIRGFRIELSEIESQILNFESMTNTLVIAKEGENGDKYLCAYVISDKVLDIKELKKQLIKNLPYYMIPQYFIQLEKFPLTTNGKVDMKLLPEPDKNIFIISDNDLPQNETEKALCKLWIEILNIKNIGVNDNFFELGGHSLKANILASRIEKEFGVVVPISELFRSATIRELALYMKNASKSIYETIPSVELKDYYEISPSQKPIFMSHNLGGKNVIWNMPGIMIIEGPLEINKFEAAINAMVKRHETMRTSFHIVDGMPVQQIHKDIEAEISYIECDEEKLDSVMKSFISPFDLDKAPLFRVGLVKLTENKHAMLFDMHHIVFDGVSISIFLNEFAIFYSGGILPELKIQYKDYAQWINKKLKTDIYIEHENYWLNTLSGDIPELEIQADYPRGNSVEGNRIIFICDSEQTVKLRNLASETGTTLYMVLLATFNVLLFKYSNQEDIIVGTFAAGRQSLELDKLIGMFVNTIGMRNFPKEHKSFSEFLMEVKENCIKAYEHQDYPFEEILPKLKLKRKPGRNPLYDTLFVLQNFDDAEVEISNLEFKQYDVDLEICPFDLILEAREQGKDIEFRLIYKNKLFSRETAEKIVNDYKKILDFVLKDNSIKLEEIEAGNINTMLENVLTDEFDFNF